MPRGQLCSGVCIRCDEHPAHSTLHDGLISVVKGQQIQRLDNRSCRYVGASGRASLLKLEATIAMTQHLQVV